MTDTEPYTPTSGVEFIDPHNLDALTEDQIDNMLEQIRERRLRALRLYQQAEEEKAQKQYDVASEKLDNQIRLLDGNIKRMDQALNALDKRINNVRALRLQLGRPIE